MTRGWVSPRLILSQSLGQKKAEMVSCWERGEGCLSFLVFFFFLLDCSAACWKVVRGLMISLGGSTGSSLI